jgi:Domain of unknown function (DUF6457)
MNTLDRWIEAACAELDIDAALVDQRMILDLARDAAHQVDRPAAPVTTFLLGVAVGRGHPPAAATRQLTALIERWRHEALPADSPPADSPPADSPPADHVPNDHVPNDPLPNDPLPND